MVAFVVIGKVGARIPSNGARGIIQRRLHAAFGKSILLLLSFAPYYADAAPIQPDELPSTPAPVSSASNFYMASAISMEASDGSNNLDRAARTFAPAPGIVDFAVDTPTIPIEPSELTNGFVAAQEIPKQRFELRKTLRQEFEYLTVEHGFRLMSDPKLRSDLLHSRFFYNWTTSLKGYDLKRWGDGDDFLVNDVAHPMQGAIASWIFLQNSPVGSTRIIGKDPQYWTSRLKGMAWAAAFEVQWKIGPLSESSIGNAGGWDYVPGCGDKPECANNRKYPPPTNNTGLSDWIVTPIVGTGWVMLEDTIDKYLATPVGEHNRLAGAILRTALEPTRNFAAMFNGVVPWNRAYGERQFIQSKKLPKTPEVDEDSWRKTRRNFGVDFVNVNLPGNGSGCVSCRQNYQGIGFPYGYRIFEHLYVDTEFTRLIGSGEGEEPSLEGLFGAKFGQQAKNWGLFAKIRPGFIYYKNAWSGGENPQRTDLFRFALDAGGAFEFYPNKRSAIRLDFGTTLVRYLQDYPNPDVSALGSIISPDYYVTQGNLQISTGYKIRF